MSEYSYIVSSPPSVRSPFLGTYSNLLGFMMVVAVRRDARTGGFLAGA
jgi:hypothetical protein